MKECLLYIVSRDLISAKYHYDDVTMTTIASQITSLTVVCSIVYSGVDQRKHQSSASLAFVRGIHRDRWIPRKRASYAENVSIWWRHHDAAHKSAKQNVYIYDASQLRHMSVVVSKIINNSIICSTAKKTSMFHIICHLWEKPSVTSGFSS